MPKGLGIFGIFQTSIRPHAMLAVCVISAWLGLSGCVLYVPPIGEKDTGIGPASFKIGKTSRSDVLKVLGDPLIDDGRFIHDELRTSAGSFLIVSSPPGAIPIGEKVTRLLLEFNEANILERMEVETGHGLYRGFAPDEPPLHKLEPLGILLPYKDFIGRVITRRFTAAAISPKGNLIAASDLSVWDPIFLIDFASRKSERISFETDGRVESVTFSPDGNSLAVLSRTIRIMDLKTRKQTVLYDGHGNSDMWEYKGALAMAYDPTGEVIASVGTGGNVKIWEASTGREIASWFAHEKRAHAIAFSPDGAILATAGGDGFVRLWDRKTGAELGTVNRGGKPVFLSNDEKRLAFSDDGKLLAITSWTHAELWRLGRESSGTSQGQKLTLDGPMDMIVLPYFFFQDYGGIPVHAVSPSFTRGGRRLLHSAGSVVVWDWAERRNTPLPIQRGDQFLAFSPDGRTMATSSPQGVRLWKLPD